MKIAIMSSVGITIDSFFPEIISALEEQEAHVYTAASTPAHVGEFSSLRWVTRRPDVRNILATREIRKWVTDVGADVLIVNTATASALARMGNLGVPVVYFCHGLHWNNGRSVSDRLWQVAEKFFLRNTSAVICINSDDHKWFSRWVPQRRLRLLPNGVGVPLNQFPLASMPADETTQLLWVGEFTHRKRPDLAIEVLSEILRSGVPARLTMLGEGELVEPTRKLARDMGVGEMVAFLGRLPFREHMPTHHALLHTAQWEGLPRVVLEAYAMGRKTFAFDVKGVRDAPGVVLAADGDTKSLASLLVESIRDAELQPPSPDRVPMDSRSVGFEVFAYVSQVLEDLRQMEGKPQ